MKSHTYRAAALALLLALWCAPAVWAEDTTTASSGSAGSFQLEQVVLTPAMFAAHPNVQDIKISIEEA